MTQPRIIQRHQRECWALFRTFDGEEQLLGPYCWGSNAEAKFEVIALWETRKAAREAQKTCCYAPTRAEKVRVTIETC